MLKQRKHAGCNIEDMLTDSWVLFCFELSSWTRQQIKDSKFWKMNNSVKDTGQKYIKYMWQVHGSATLVTICSNGISQTQVYSLSQNLFCVCGCAFAILWRPSQQGNKRVRWRLCLKPFLLLDHLYWPTTRRGTCLHETHRSNLQSKSTYKVISKLFLSFFGGVPFCYVQVGWYPALAVLNGNQDLPCSALSVYHISPRYIL